MPQYTGTGIPYFDVAWAADGILATIPDAPASDGSASYTQGWTTPYELVSTNPAYLPVPLNYSNQVLNDITSLLKYLGKGWAPPFITTAMNGGVNPFSYGLYAFASFDAGSGLQNWISVVADNTTIPGASSNWQALGQGQTAIFNGGTSTGSANAQTVTTSQGNFAGTAGQVITFKAGFSTTASSTLTADTAAAMPLKVGSITGLANTGTNDIISGVSYMGVSDGTNIIILNPSRYAPLASPTFTGVPAAPTAALNTATTQLATCLFANPGASLAATGYVTLPSGLIIQWDTFTTSASGFSNWTFPLTFPAALYGVGGTLQSTVATDWNIQYNPAASSVAHASVAASDASNTFKAGTYTIFAWGK